MCVRIRFVRVKGVFFSPNLKSMDIVPNKLSLSRSLSLSLSLTLSPSLPLSRARTLSLYNSASGNKLSRLDSQFHQSLILAERFRRTLLPSSARGMGPA